MEYIRRAGTDDIRSSDISIIFSLVDRKGALVEALQQFKVSSHKTTGPGLTVICFPG